MARGSGWRTVGGGQWMVDWVPVVVGGGWAVSELFFFFSFFFLSSFLEVLLLVSLLACPLQPVFA